jgi:hypothetical protein
MLEAAQSTSIHSCWLVSSSAGTLLPRWPDQVRSARRFAVDDSNALRLHLWPDVRQKAAAFGAHRLIEAAAGHGKHSKIGLAPGSTYGIAR